MVQIYGFRNRNHTGVAQCPGEGDLCGGGAVFVGDMAPAAVGDYVAGPSHVLPTDSTARFASALTIDDFLKEIHVVEMDQEALSGVADTLTTIAEAENLNAHALSVRLRIEKK